MALEGKVARLCVAGVHEGSAWLLNPQHALTALHCIQDVDGSEKEGLSLHFYGLNLAIPVTVLEQAAGIDVAVLQLDLSTLNLAQLDTRLLAKLNPATADILARHWADPAAARRAVLDFHLQTCVIPLSRRLSQEHDPCRMHGHPDKTQANHPDGMWVESQVLQVQHLYRGKGGYPDYPVIQFYNNSIAPGEQGSTRLHGLSGGPVVLNQAGSQGAAIGLVSFEDFDGNYLHAISVLEMAEKIALVKQALCHSPHIDPDENRLCLKLADLPGHIFWSAPKGPECAGQLWGQQPFAQELYCFSTLPELGCAGKAVLRLACHAAFQCVFVPDLAHWQKMALALGALATRKLKLAALDSVAQPLASLPAKLNRQGCEQLAQIIHHSLNWALLEQLEHALYDYLYAAGEIESGIHIETRLKHLMAVQWQLWLTQFKARPELWQAVLVWIFSSDGVDEGVDEVLLRVGSCAKVQQQLMDATLFALALAAANIKLEPALDPRGNLLLDGKSGHLCGIKHKQGRRLDLMVKNIDWRAEILILPGLEMPLLALFEMNTALHSMAGTLGHAAELVPPVAVTAEPAFLMALERGAGAVKAYFDMRMHDYQNRINQIAVPARMEKLHV